jgi:hypothetical protein
MWVNSCQMSNISHGINNTVRIVGENPLNRPEFDKVFIGIKVELVI